MTSSFPLQKRRTPPPATSSACERADGGRAKVGHGSVAKSCRLSNAASQQFVGTYFERSAILGLFKWTALNSPPPSSSATPAQKMRNPTTKSSSNSFGTLPVHWSRRRSDHRGLGQAWSTGRRHHDWCCANSVCPDGFQRRYLEVARERSRAIRRPTAREGRTDLTEVTVITIDPADARDFDDAISLERFENGHWRLGVHIADVSHFVSPKTALDREARDRATSVYLPDRVIPMIPEIISNHLASLQPDQVRFTKTAFIEFTADGARVATRFLFGCDQEQATIQLRRSRRLLGGPARVASRNWSQMSFTLLDEHAPTGDDPAQAAVMNGAASNCPCRKSRSSWIVTGEVTGACGGTHRKPPDHRRVHAGGQRSGRRATERRQDCVPAANPRDSRSPQVGDTDGVRSASSEFTARVCESRFEIQRVLQKSRTPRSEQAVNYAVLRSMQKAVYSPQDGGPLCARGERLLPLHLSNPPLSRPDDPSVDGSIIRKKSPNSDVDHLMNLGEHCSQREQRAEAAERELIKLKLLNYYSKRIGETMEVVITGVEEFGVFAQGIEIASRGIDSRGVSSAR